MTTRDAKGGDQITDADALLPNGCELTNYLEGGTTNNRTKFAVIIRNGSQSTTPSRPVATEPLLPIGKYLLILTYLRLSSMARVHANQKIVTEERVILAGFVWGSQSSHTFPFSLFPLSPFPFPLPSLLPFPPFSPE